MTDSQKLDLIIDILGGPSADFTRLIDEQKEEIFIKESSLDGVGRITIPKSIRRELDIDETTRLKIYRGNNEIIIKKG